MAQQIHAAPIIFRKVFITLYQPSRRIERFSPLHDMSDDGR